VSAFRKFYAITQTKISDLEAKAETEKKAMTDLLNAEKMKVKAVRKDLNEILHKVEKGVVGVCDADCSICISKWP
jgi:hypothetical protein